MKRMPKTMSIKDLLIMEIRGQKESVYQRRNNLKENHVANGLIEMVLLHHLMYRLLNHIMPRENKSLRIGIVLTAKPMLHISSLLKMSKSQRKKNSLSSNLKISLSLTLNSTGNTEKL